MELSSIEIKYDPDKGFQAELRADAPWGDRGNYITIGGWGETEAMARDQIEVALKALGLTVEGIGKALTRTN